SSHHLLTVFGQFCLGSLHNSVRVCHSMDRPRHYPEQNWCCPDRLRYRYCWVRYPAKPRFGLKGQYSHPKSRDCRIWAYHLTHPEPQTPARRSPVRHPRKWNSWDPYPEPSDPDQSSRHCLLTQRHRHSCYWPQFDPKIGIVAGKSFEFRKKKMAERSCLAQGHPRFRKTAILASERRL